MLYLRSLFVLVLVVTGTAAAQPATVSGRAIERVEVRGTRRVEPDTIRQQLRTVPGAVLDAAQLRDDLRAIWKLGLFAALDAEAEVGPSGGAIVTLVVTERPSIRKVMVAGNRGLGLDEINRVLELERGAIVDPSKVRRGRDKIAALYAEHGFYLATVDHAIEPVGETEVDVRFTVDEQAKVRIRDVEFIGNRAISDAELRGVIATRRPGALAFLDGSGVYHRDAFGRDLVIVAAHYMDRGYANVRIGSPAIRMSRDKKDVYLAVTVDEGPVFTVGAVDFHGELIGSPAANLGRVKLRTGRTFSRSLLEDDRHALATYYQDQGYASATVMPRPRVDLANRQVHLTFEVARGKRAYFERINIRGDSKTRDQVIRRELAIAEGELFSATNLERSKRRVTALGFFDNVAVSTRRGSSDELVVAELEVRERPTGTFQIGAGLSSAEGPILQAQIAEHNLSGRGQAVTVQAQLSGIRKLLLFRFVEPNLLDTDWTVAVDLYKQRRGLGGYARDALGGALTWGYPLSYNVRAFLSYKLEDVAISGGSGGIANLGATTSPIGAERVSRLFRGGLTSSVRGSLAWDSRDNRLFPTAGWYATAFVEYASRYTGSETQFLRWGGFARYYRRLWGPFVLRLNAELGVTTSIDPEGVPISERYLLGGISDVRGYPLRSLGPRLLTQVPGDVGQPLDDRLPLGGNAQVIGNAEIEFPLVKKLGISGVVFFDVGNAFNLEDRYCAGARRATSPVPAAIDPCVSPGSALGGLRTSVGLGLRWLSPVGPLRLEWGIPLDLQRGEKPAGLEFTVGTSF